MATLQHIETGNAAYISDPRSGAEVLKRADDLSRPRQTPNLDFLSGDEDEDERQRI